MSKIEHSYLCLYGHFSQPPRGNPLTQVIGTEQGAEPFKNWNERITHACYEPNANTGNFELISFSFGQALMTWLKQRKPEIYAQIISGDHASLARNNDTGGGALATAYHHSILPLARKRDKRTQIIWGMDAFEDAYGRKPLGFWLPEMAVDLETLTLLAESGIRYTVLARKQIRDLPPDAAAGPYRVQMSRSRSMDVFVRDDALSSEISFNIHNLGGAGHWSRTVLMPERKPPGSLLLVATAGETFGHHYAGEEQFLYWLASHEAQAIGFKTTTLDAFYLNNEAGKTVQIEDPSSWSDQPGLTNWATGTAGKVDTTWKGALRRALDNAASELDRVYEDLCRACDLDPWKLRDKYAPVLLGTMDEQAFIEEYTSNLSAAEQDKLKRLLITQELGQRMYNSYTFTGDDLNGTQPRYAIACAAAALSLAQQATDRVLTERLLPDLAVVTSTGSPITGTDILRSVVQEYDLELGLD